MNKYLLLRDNKQSGPYTVPEIIAKGIKPYDLVWLEGKSAAWRYPSEVDELKAYAPAIEEQPFDRFYKKPSTSVAASNGAPGTSHPPEVSNGDNSSLQRYMPASLATGDKPAKKVYINLPSGASAPMQSATAAQVTPMPATITKTDPAPVAITQTIKQSAPPFPDRSSRHNAIDDLLLEREIAHFNRSHNGKGKDRRMFFAAVAACIVLGIVSGILYFNYRQQSRDLKELNTIVQQLESNKQQAAAAVPTSLVNDTKVQEPPAPPESGTIPQTATNEFNNQPAVSNSPAAGKKPASKKAAKEKEEAPLVVFKETSLPENPDNALPPETTAPAKTNLFSLVKVTPNAYKTGLLGGISNLQFELSNNSSVLLHRVAVEVKYLGPEKKVVKRQTIYFENVSPGSHSTIEVPKSNRGVSIEYTITDIKS